MFDYDLPTTTTSGTRPLFERLRPANDYDLSACLIHQDQWTHVMIPVATTLESTGQTYGRTPAIAT